MLVSWGWVAAMLLMLQQYAMLKKMHYLKLGRGAAATRSFWVESMRIGKALYVYVIR